MNQHIGLAATQIPEFASSVNLLVELKLSERYRMGVSIARGGCGAIYQAWDQLLDRSVAVKILLADDPTHVELKRFADEARVLGQLQHPHIPPVYDFGKILVSDAVYLACQDDEPTPRLNQTPLPRPACRERPFLAMKLVAGKTLAQILKSHSSQTKRLDLLPVFESICQAVGYAHEVGFIHRDLKPANVMVGAFGEVQVMDWGLAKNIAVRETVDDLPIRTDIAGDDLTLCGTVMGTPDYMPPEQARGEIDRIDERSDVFSLGAILFEILTGTPPLTGAITEVVRGYACEKYIDRLTILDAIEGDTELKSLVKQCLSPDPAQRPRNGKEVADAIMSYRLDAERRVRQAEMQSVQATLMLQENQRRRVIVFRSAISIAFLLIAGIVGTTIFGIRAGKSEIKATQISDQLADANNSLSYRLEQIQRGNDLVFGLIDDFDVRTARSETESVEVQLARRLVRLNDNLTRDPIDDPEIDYKMKYRVGKALTHAGDFESAKRVFTSLREECLARYGLEHRKTLECSNALAEVYGEIGQQHDTALALTNQHYPLAEKVLGVQDEVTLSMAIGHVCYFAYAKQPQKAIEVGERVIPLVLAKYGPDHEESFSIRNNLALAYFGIARYDDAVRLYLENKVILDKRYGPYHPFSIKTLGNLTNNYQALGKKELHLECAEEASRRAHEKYGNNHRDTILYDINLANLYEELKRPVDAIRIREQLLPVIRRVYGPQHAMYIQCSQQLIELYVKSGRLDDVELFANNMLKELQKNQHGEKVDGEQADPKNASIKLDIQRENVISLYERLIQNQNEVNKNYVEMGKRLGQLYREAKRPAQAIATYERLYKHCLKIYGPDHDETAEIAIPLADWCLWEKRYTDAITLYEFLRPHWN
ncbi:MAG: serine/threonine-protein kinase, partial [Gemmataceae bacterium]